MDQKKIFDLILINLQNVVILLTYNLIIRDRESMEGHETKIVD